MNQCDQFTHAGEKGFSRGSRRERLGSTFGELRDSAEALFCQSDKKKYRFITYDLRNTKRKRVKTNVLVLVIVVTSCGDDELAVRSPQDVLPLDVPLKSEIFYSGSVQALPITARGQRAFSISSVVNWNCS